jgi:hypothetical protein
VYAARRATRCAAGARALVARQRRRALVELDAPEADSAVLQARIENAHGTSDWFRWARVSVADVDALAASARLGVVERWRSEGRWFARLAPRHY